MSMNFRPKSIDYLSTSSDFQAGLAAGTWYSSYLNLASIAGVDQLGTEYVGTGNVGSNLWGRFAIVRAKAALAAGQVVTQDAPTQGTYTAAGSTVAVINTNITASSANCFVGGYIYFNDLQVSKPIKANTTGANCSITISLPNATIAGGTVTTATPPFDPDALTAAQLATLTDGHALSVQMPFDVKVCTNALVPEGIALGTVTSGNYTIIQRGGYSLALCVGTSPALTTGVPAIISSTAGSIIGGGGSANAYVAQQIVPRITYTTSAAILVPVMVNF